MSYTEKFMSLYRNIEMQMVAQTFEHHRYELQRSIYSSNTQESCIQNCFQNLSKIHQVRNCFLQCLFKELINIKNGIISTSNVIYAIQSKITRNYICLPCVRKLSFDKYKIL
uniref:Uncharacterized protein n=1 Tax=Micrurus lemniscatus lemniscatus TaxID=129467 RepID=A0A2D4HXD6_MICLE